MIKAILCRFEEYLGAVMLAIMACIAFINVIIRYCTNFSFSYSEELTVNFFVWIVLLGTSRAFREGTNFSMNVLFNAMPLLARKVLYVFGMVCSIVFFVLLAWLGAAEVMDEYELGVVSESLAIPVYLYTMVTPILSVVTIIRIFQRAVDDFRHGVFHS